MLLVLSFLLLLSLAPFACPNQTSAVGRSAVGAMPLSGTATFTESFSATTYRDAGATTAQGWGTGAVTSPRAYSVQLLDSFSTPSPVRALDVQDQKAYIVLYNSSSATDALRALSISNPYSITQLGTRSIATKLLAAEVDGDVVYVGTGYNAGLGCWLASYNVTNPYSIPSPLDSLWLTSGNITDFDVQGHFLFAAVYRPADNHGLVIFDVEDPASLDRIANAVSYRELLGIDVDGQLTFLADGSYGLFIENVSNPYATSTVGSVNTPGNATDVLVDGHLAYVADGPSGVHIVDVSHPATPIILGSYNTPGNALRLALQGKTLFVADGAGGLQVLDVANPSHPVSVTSISLPYTYDVELYGGDVLVAAQDGVYAYRIGHGITALPLVGVYAGYQAWDVRVRGDIAYVAAGPDGLVTLNVSDPAHPVLLDQDIQGSGPFYRKLDVQGNLVYVANYLATTLRGVMIYDASDPANLHYLARIGLTLQTDVAVAGDVLWIADSTSGIWAYNVSNPYSISGIATVPPAGNTTALWVQGYHLYAVSDYGGSGNGFCIYDIRDISSPALIGWQLRQSYHYDVFVDGDYAPVADKYWMSYFNVTNPFVPNYSDEIYNASLNWLGVWGFGPYVLQVGAPGGVALVNATIPSSLRICAAYSGATSAIQVTVHGDYAYVANRASLVILRLFESAGACFSTVSASAQSLAVDATDDLVVNATLSIAGYFPADTGIAWELSADGGAHWEAVTPGVVHTFTNTGSDLRWRAIFTTTLDDRSAYLYGVSITYGHVTLPPPPIPGFPLPAIFVGMLVAVGLGVLRRRNLRKR
jgi:hypothetical protein